jgi:hypothetical protein
MTAKEQSIEFVITKLELMPGDTLLVKTFNKLCEADMDKIKSHFSRLVPPNVRVFVYSGKEIALSTIPQISTKANLANAIMHEFYLVAMDRAEKSEAAEELLKAAVKNLIDYRKRNTQNFQLEKADDYLSELEHLVYGQPAA